MQIEEGVVHRCRRHNSSYPTQPHLLIANYMSWSLHPGKIEPVRQKIIIETQIPVSA